MDRIFSVFVIEPCAAYPQYDEQLWQFMTWKGTAIPLGKRLGEWAWVGRVY